MKISLFNKKAFDYLDLYLTVPIISINKKFQTIFDENDKITVLEFNTKISYETSDIGWCFVIKVLGFGIKLNRQFSY